MADGRGNSRTIGIVIGAIVLLLLLAWLFGLFGGGDGAEVETGDAVVTEEGAATEEAAEEAAEDVEEAAEDAEEAAD